MEIKEIVDRVMENIEPTTDKETADFIRNFLLENGEEMAKNIAASMPSEEDIRKDIDKALQEHCANLPEKFRKLHKETLEKVYIEGKTYGEAIGLTKDDIDVLYNLGYSYYNMGQYKEARALFAYLTVLDRREPRFFFAAGAAYQMLKDYESAEQFYSYCTTLDFLNPVPFYHLADCYIHLNRDLDAAVALKNVISRTKNTKMYGKIRDKAQLLLDAILKKIDQEEKVMK